MERAYETLTFDCYGTLIDWETSIGDAFLLLAGMLGHFTVPFDLVITAQQVGSYKPAAGHFLTARSRIGDERWLHAARSYFHDVIPARALGVPTAWINRKRETAPDGGRATREFGDLAALAEWLTNDERRTTNDER